MSLSAPSRLTGRARPLAPRPSSSSSSPCDLASDLASPSPRGAGIYPACLWAPAALLGRVARPPCQERPRRSLGDAGGREAVRRGPLPPRLRRVCLSSSGSRGPDLSVWPFFFSPRSESFKREGISEFLARFRGVDLCHITPDSALLPAAETHIFSASAFRLYLTFSPKGGRWVICE